MFWKVLLSPQRYGCDGRPARGGSDGSGLAPHSLVTEASVLVMNFQSSKTSSLQASQDLYPEAILSREVDGQFLSDHVLSRSSDIHLPSSVGVYKGRCGTVQMTSNQLNLPRGLRCSCRNTWRMISGNSYKVNTVNTHVNAISDIYIYIFATFPKKKGKEFKNRKLKQNISP